MSTEADAMNEKIGGFDRYEVEEAARTLIGAEKVKRDKRKGFLTIVMKEVEKQADAADDAALTARTAVRLKKAFGSKK